MRVLTSYGAWGLVTGASAGIGMAFARRFAAEGLNVALVARRADRLAALADELTRRHGVQTRVVPEDLSQAGAAERIVERTADLEVGLLVNNAGFSAVGRFDRVPRHKIVEMIQVNCVAVAALAHAYLPKMRERGRGALVILASVAGYQPLGFAATYGATKAFDLMLAEALWAENRGSGVDVLAVSPGPVATEFQAVAGETPHGGVTPESVVHEALAALGRKPSVITGGALNRMRTWSVRLAPRRQVARLALGVMRGFVPEALR
ncbi:MAG TPA: SDR family oxidoreductase [Candidatus Binatia bacterium]|nr:SDR family oxidoreductase [Candidatus Binatia bacterium]